MLRGVSSGMPVVKGCSRGVLRGVSAAGVPPPVATLLGGPLLFACLWGLARTGGGAGSSWASAAPAPGAPSSAGSESSRFRASSRAMPSGSSLSLDQNCSKRRFMGSSASWSPPSSAAPPCPRSRRTASKRRRKPAVGSLNCRSSLCVSARPLSRAGSFVCLATTRPSLIPRNARLPATSTRLLLAPVSRSGQTVPLWPSASACMPRRNASQRFVCLCISTSWASLKRGPSIPANSVMRSFFGSLRSTSFLLIV
mmetsp:Transcript_36884/g.104056  ORF Transcript_36884/g.104056 Transcript_36884/m.104056 type:complete len:254 (-) Transcript_36884:471-1232(-)